VAATNFVLSGFFVSGRKTVAGFSNLPGDSSSTALKRRFCRFPATTLVIQLENLMTSTPTKLT
jgi:hypothetical protein